MEILVQVEQLSPLRYGHVVVMPLKVFVKPIDGAAMLAAHEYPVQGKAGKYTLLTHRRWLQNRAQGRRWCSAIVYELQHSEVGLSLPAPIYVDIC
jgi:hypothetical protein